MVFRDKQHRTGPRDEKTYQRLTDKCIVLSTMQYYRAAAEDHKLFAAAEDDNLFCKGMTKLKYNSALAKWNQ